MKIRNKLLISTFIAISFGIASPAFSQDISINPDYKAGQIGGLDDKSSQIRLDDLIENTPIQKEDEDEEEEDKLRLPALQDAAIAYGSRNGLAWATNEINKIINEEADKLTKAFNFEALLIKTDDNIVILPPVISEAKDTWESQNEGKSLRIADTYYEIIKDEKFTYVTPEWSNYLLRTYSKPSLPANSLLPKNEKEKEMWDRYVTEGWFMGIKQSLEQYKVDLRRLVRDFEGMARYKSLLARNMVKPPEVQSGSLGNTGGGDTMRINDKSIDITRDSELNTNSSEWNY